MNRVTGISGTTLEQGETFPPLTKERFYSIKKNNRKNKSPSCFPVELSEKSSFMNTEMSLEEDIFNNSGILF